MNTPTPARHAGFVAVMIAMIAAAFAGSASALEANPPRIELKTISSSAEIVLTHDNAPVPASAVQSVKLLVGKHDYDHMIEVGKADGRITVRPSDMLELGTYDLAIKTTQGEVRVAVLALLEIVDSSLKARAARLGVTVEEVKARLGISQTIGQERLELGLPPLYYLGQVLTMPPMAKAGRRAEWTVNGRAAGGSDGGLTYVFEQAGVYDVAYVEKEADRTVAVGLGTLTVAPEPRLPVKLDAGTTVTLNAPEGYETFAWSLDGKEAGTDSKWMGSFDAPGGHEISVRASSPRPGTSQAFRVITYAVTVP